MWGQPTDRSAGEPPSRGSGLQQGQQGLGGVAEARKPPGTVSLARVHPRFGIQVPLWTRGHGPFVHANQPLGRGGRLLQLTAISCAQVSRNETLPPGGGERPVSQLSPGGGGASPEFYPGLLYFVTLSSLEYSFPIETFNSMVCYLHLCLSNLSDTRCRSGNITSVQLPFIARFVISWE